MARNDPVLACGFRFEEEALVERMVAEVESERGALPLLAFTAARLWEHRDRERGVIPSDAYETIGGVAGSLAQHAETTLEHIGTGRQEIVREIFRHLMTAKGTRISRGREELLSAFPDKSKADEVLSQLIDARLLTSYETIDPNDPSARLHRIEVIHESLLSNWPRLVRWQTQDADGAQLHDQLRQAAHLWEGHGGPDDMLWTGTVYQEFRLWRDRYPGGLTSTEEAFAKAMTTRARRAQRRRRLVLGAAFATLLIVLGVIGTLWKRAVAEARRAESGKLYTMAQNAPHPPTALAYALRALELSDVADYRRLAFRLLLQAPSSLDLPPRPNSHNSWAVDFSPDGNWLAVGWSLDGGLRLYPMDGGEPRELVGHRNWILDAHFSEDSKLLVSSGNDSTVRLWSIPEGKMVRTLKFGMTAAGYLRGNPPRLLTYECAAQQPLLWKEWPIEDGDARILGPTGPVSSSDPPNGDLDPTGNWFVTGEGSNVVRYALPGLPLDHGYLVGQHARPILFVRFAPDGDRVVSVDLAGEVHISSIRSGLSAPIRILQAGVRCMEARFDRTGSFLAVCGIGARLWDLNSPGLAPLVLDDQSWVFNAAFDPNRRWLVTAGGGGRVGHVGAWPLVGYRPACIEGVGPSLLAFAPDGSYLAETPGRGIIQISPLDGATIGLPKVLFSAEGYSFSDLRTDESGRHIFGTVFNSDLGEGTLVRVTVATREVETWKMDAGDLFLDSSGRWVAASGQAVAGRAIRLLDTATGRLSEFGTPKEQILGFDATDRLLSLRQDQVMVWNTETPEARELWKRNTDDWVILCPDKRTLLVVDREGHLTLRGIEGTDTRPIPSSSDGHGVSAVGISPSVDLIAFGHGNGDVDVISTRTADRCRLPIHADVVQSIAVDPLGRWIASSSEAGTVLWPTPDLDSPLELPRQEVLRRLRSVTSLRAIPDAKNPAGYRVEGTVIPDWQHPPTW
jgi:WD40 repeat protein